MHRYLVVIVMVLALLGGAAAQAANVVRRIPPPEDPAPILTPRPVPRPTTRPTPIRPPTGEPAANPTPAPAPTPSSSPAPAQPAGPPGLLRTLETSERVVAVTFDDGPSPEWTPRILALLAAHDAHATFFVLCQEAERHPDVVHTIAAAGHQVAGHTFSHRDLTGLGEDGYVAEVDRTNRLITDLTGSSVTCVRPPFGAFDAHVVARLAARGLDTAMWSVDTRDWSRPGTGAIVERAIGGLAPGAVVLFHDGGGDRSQTLAALEQFLAAARTDGYGVVPMCAPRYPAAS